MPQCKPRTAACWKTAWHDGPSRLWSARLPYHRGGADRELRPGGRPKVYAEACVRETGVRNGAVGADKFGFDGLEAVHWNLAEPPLYEYAIQAGEAELAYGGALCADTGVHTGRSPKDKFIVRDELSEKNVWWDNNGALTPA